MGRISPAAAQSAKPSTPLTIEKVLSAPFPSNLTLSPDGALVAWVYDIGGSRNVWVAKRGANGTWAARTLTQFKGDDGQDIGQLSWDAHGRTLYFSRGGDLDTGSTANAASLVSGGPIQAVWSVSLGGRPPLQIAPGHSPAASPAGDAVAFIENDQVWLAKDGGRPEPLIRDGGACDSLAWAPDGRRLAFVSHRGDHALIGVYVVGQQSIQWLAPSIDTVGAPVWSPDGRWIAFLNLPHGWEHPYIPRSVGLPWSISLSDVRTGATKQVWIAPQGPGSVFHAESLARSLFWGAGDRLLFFWERTGWRHLYALPFAGGDPVDLTPGEGEVFDLSLSPDGRRVAYVSNLGDLDRRHTWEVSVAGGAPRQRTIGDGIEDSPRLADDGRLFVLQAGAKQSLHTFMIDAANRSRPFSGMPPLADYPLDQLVEPQPVLFPAADGLMLHGQLFLPPPARAGKRPAIIFFHGGPQRQMLLGWHPMGAYNFMYGMNEYLASEGYVVLSVNYRGGEGYGVDFRESPGIGPTGASELNDILGAAKLLQARPDVDPRRIGVWGGSYGGLMTALALSRAPALFAAGVDYAGIHDWAALAKSAGASVPKALEAVVDESSVVSKLDKWTAPVLVVHGDDDHTVPFSQSIELVDGLRNRGVAVEQQVLPNETHDLLLRRSWLQFYHSADDFFRHYLALSTSP